MLRFDSATKARQALFHLHGLSRFTNWRVSHITSTAFNMAQGSDNPTVPHCEAEIVIVFSSIDGTPLSSNEHFVNNMYRMINLRLAVNFKGNASVRQSVAKCCLDGKVAHRLEMDSVSGADMVVRRWNRGAEVTIPGTKDKVRSSLVLRDFFSSSLGPHHGVLLRSGAGPDAALPPAPCPPGQVQSWKPRSGQLAPSRQCQGQETQ
jgi:hypothetical protein